MSVAPPRDPDPGIGTDETRFDPFSPEALALDDMFESVAAVPENIAVPPHGDGGRARRQGRHHPEVADPPLTLRSAVLYVAVPVLVLVAVLATISSGLDHGEGSLAGPPGSVADVAAAADSHVALVVQTGVDGSVSGITVVGVGTDAGGHVLFVPVGAMAEVPSFGLEEIGRAHELGGMPLLRSAVENLLGVQVTDVVMLDPDGFRSLVAPLTPMTVDVPADIEQRDESGRVQVVLAAGEAALDADQLEVLLDEPGGDSELQRLVRHQAFWQALLGVLDDGAPPSGVGGDDTLFSLLAALDSGDVSYHTLPVEAVGGAVGEGELYRVDRAAVDALVARAFPGSAALSDADRIRVQILNGTGEPGLAQQVTIRVVPAGARVVVIDNADRFDHETTQVVFYDRENQDDAERIRDALGVGEVVFSRERLDVVDVTVVVGRDFDA